ncbi:hypothetical protein [Leptolyngbya sp. GGD]|nr:hypothetical protein [Leptolyngbya sp. GGD]MCY6492664.1 hypothetical protein [Leptolyngbya sp. GGD]
MLQAAHLHKYAWFGDRSQISPTCQDRIGRDNFATVLTLQRLGTVRSL